MPKRVKALLYVDADVLADLRELVARLKSDASRAGRKVSEADNMSDIAEAALRAEIAKRRKHLARKATGREAR